MLYFNYALNHYKLFEAKLMDKKHNTIWKTMELANKFVKGSF